MSARQAFAIPAAGAARDATFGADRVGDESADGDGLDTKYKVYIEK